MPLIAEIPLAPLAIPPLGEVLPPLLIIAACLFALGFVYFLDGVIRALFWLLIKVINGIPFVSLGDNFLHAVASGMTEALGFAETKLDNALGHSWHKLARVSERLGRTLYNEAALMVGVVTLQHGLFEWKRGQSAQTQSLGAKVGKFDMRSRALGQQERADAKRLHAQAAHAQTVAHSAAVAGHLVYEPELVRLRARTSATSKTLNRWIRWARRHEFTLTTALAASIVTVAFRRLGLRWLRCSKWSKLGPKVCNLPGHWFDDLLGLITDFFFLANICQVIPWLEEGFSTVAAPLVSQLSHIGAGLCAGSEGRATIIGTPALHLPAVSPITLRLP